MRILHAARWMMATALILATSGVIAQSAMEIYKSAGAFYKQKQFSEAAASYEKLLAQGYRSADVYYNLGNCYFKMDSMGKCILNYERALRLAPDDEDAAHNLRLANLRIIDKIEPVPQLAILTWWNHLLESHASKTWANFSLMVLWLALLFAGAGLFLGRKRFSFSIAGFMAMFSFVFLFFASVQRQHENATDRAILMAASANVKSAPDDHAGNLFLLHEGTRLQILDRVGEWNKIRLEDGKVGWIPRRFTDVI